MPAKKNKLAFVIMPFKKERWEVYKYGIKPACEKAGFEAVRVDQLKKGHYNINRKIIEHIFKSDAIVAELTDMNPNVFYEMGVAHAIANKTIMIAQNAKDLPFDIRNYRCIIYEQSVDGLKELAEEIVESLSSIEEWRNDPSNPVQDFKPEEIFILPDKLKKLQDDLQEKNRLVRQAQKVAEKLQAALQEKEVLLKNTASKSEIQSLQRTVQQKDEVLEKSRATLAKANKQLHQKQAEIEALTRKLQQKPAAPKAKPGPKIELRAAAKEEFSAQEVKAMIAKHDFFCAESDWSKEWSNPSGKGVEHDYVVQHDGQTILDRATGLMWQQGGSKNYMNYSDAQKYIADLNRQKVGGYDDWRLPTLEEAMSLMQPQKQDGLYIDAKFAREQPYIWTADTYSASLAWVVGFYGGYCRHSDIGVTNFVRAVRRGQS